MLFFKSGCPNNVDNVTFDKCRDELQDITVNWGHSTLFVSYTYPPPHYSIPILNTVSFPAFNLPYENCIGIKKSE